MRSSWSTADIPNLNGMTAVVTGASNGIGLEIARGLAARGCQVVLAVRSVQRGNAAASAIRATSPGASLEVMVLDLADLASVRRFADALRQRFQRIDLLINNAAATSDAPPRTADGFESAFGINHLGHFALTGLLLPTMLVTPKARVVTQTSLVQGMGHIDFESLCAPTGNDKLRAYAQSKLATLLFAYEFQRRLSASGAELLSVACHPGVAATPSLLGSPDKRQHGLGALMPALIRRFAQSPAQGARPALFAATSPDVCGGDLIGPGGRRSGVWGRPARVRSSDRGYDEDLAQHLWQVSESMTGVRYTFGEADSGAEAKRGLPDAVGMS